MSTEGTTGDQDFKLSDFLFRTVDGSKWKVTDQETFDFAGFFDWMIDCRHLLLHKSELTWMEKQEVPSGAPVDVFVNMSCGSQLAPHLTLEIVGICRALGISFVAGSGRQFCCGKIYKTRDNWDAGDKMSNKGLDHFQSWGAKTAVHQCHSCQIVYSEYSERVADAAPALENIHLSAFIERRLIELGDRIPWKKRLDGMKVLVEGFGPELSPVHDAATKAEARMLAMIPGVEVLGIVEPPARGAPCKTGTPGGPSVLAGLTHVEVQEVKDELAAQAARRGGANVIAPNAHYCHHEWCKFASDKLAVRNWISILADALGCPEEDRYQKYWNLRNPEEVIRLTEPNWRSWGLTPEKAKWAAMKHFDPHYTGFINQACACGGDPTRCTTGLEAGGTPIAVGSQVTEGHEA